MTTNLRFAGQRFPRAKIENTTVNVVLKPDGTEARLDDQPPVFSVYSPTAGKLWDAETAEGWWADFATLDLRQESEVRTFVRRRGMTGPVPYGAPARESTSHWPTLQKSLQILLRAWEPTADGSLEITDIRKWIDAYGDFYMDYEADRVRGELRAIPGPLIPPFRAEDPEEDRSIKPVLADPGPAFIPLAQTLSGYMFASAAIGHRQRLPMRKCTWCGSHFFRARVDSRFCSASCRTREYERSKQDAAA